MLVCLKLRAKIVFFYEMSKCFYKKDSFKVEDW